MGLFSDLLSNPTLDRSKMTAKDNGKRKGDWYQPVAEWLSDAIPNEFSKMNNPWVSNIPYVGWGIRGIAAADNFNETYANTGDMGGASQAGFKGIMAQSSDPYLYSPKNQPGLSGDWGSDWASNFGKIAGATRGVNTTGVFSDYDENATGYYPMTGVGVGTDQDPNYNGQGSGYGAIGGMVGSYIGNRYGGSMGGQLGSQLGSGIGQGFNGSYQNAYNSPGAQPTSVSGASMGLGGSGGGFDFLGALQGLQGGSGAQGTTPVQPAISQQDQYANMLNELMMRKRQELELQRRMSINPNFDSLPKEARITMGNPYNGQYSPARM